MSSAVSAGVGEVTTAPVSLLPRSGIGVAGGELVIAPPGNPAIRLDARLLDRVELIGRSPTGAAITSGAAAVGAAASALLQVSGVVFVVAGLGYFACERFAEARRRARSRDLLLALGDLEVALHVADGPDAAKRIADQLAPYTRSAPITRPEVYEDARRRLAVGVSGDRARLARREIDRALAIGTDTVSVAGPYLQVGTISFRVDEVRDFALRGANLALPGGRFLQAAMALLVVAADERSRAGEDLEALARRVGEYEAWTGRSAGR
ncbi:MAG: hypothetical protein R3B06_10440 [Kofleriaceae bacterium]